MGKTLRKWADPYGSKKKGKEELKKKEKKALQAAQATVKAKEDEIAQEEAVAEQSDMLRRRAAYATSTYRFSRGETPDRQAVLRKKKLLG